MVAALVQFIVVVCCQALITLAAWQATRSHIDISGGDGLMGMVRL